MGFNIIKITSTLADSVLFLKGSKRTVNGNMSGCSTGMTNIFRTIAVQMVITIAGTTRGSFRYLLGAVDSNMFNLLTTITTVGRAVGKEMFRRATIATYMRVRRATS